MDWFTCSDKHLTVDVSIVQNAKTRYGGLLLVDNRSCIAFSKALRKPAFDVVLMREDIDIHRHGATYFSQLINGCLARVGPPDFAG